MIRSSGVEGLDVTTPLGVVPFSRSQKKASIPRRIAFITPEFVSENNAGGGLGNSGYGFGTVFEVTASGAESVLYRFGGGTDGAVPQDSLTDAKGLLYGTTVNGGSGTGPCGGLSGTTGCGTIFKISVTGSYQSLYSFQGGTDGEYPYAGVTDFDGSLYGTTADGGGASCGGGGCGTKALATLSLRIAGSWNKRLT